MRIQTTSSVRRMEVDRSIGSRPSVAGAFPKREFARVSDFVSMSVYFHSAFEWRFAFYHVSLAFLEF